VRRWLLALLFTEVPSRGVLGNSRSGVFRSVGHDGTCQGTRPHLKQVLVDASNPAQVGPAQVGHEQVGTAEVGLYQDGPSQVGPAQVGSSQIDSAQVGPAQVSASEINYRLTPVYQPRFLQEKQQYPLAIGMTPH
jgi:hypothetical protein